MAPASLQLHPNCIPLPLRERIDRHSIPEPNTGCWLWTGQLSASGYGKLEVNRNGRRCKLSAHRVAFEVYKGPIPDGLCLDHLCRQRSCINPDHLEPVTKRENARRGVVARHGNLRVVIKAQRAMVI